MNELHQILKTTTREVHNDLENSSILRFYLDKTLTAELLDKILVQTFYAYQLWQQQLDASFENLNIDPDWQINLNPDRIITQSINNTPNNIPPLQLNSPEQYLGCAYVFAGSQLGAKIIYQALSQNPNLKSSQFSYFQENPQQQISWSKWIEELYEYSLNNQYDFMKIGNGAKSCFETLNKWFNKFRIA